MFAICTKCKSCYRTGSDNSPIPPMNTASSSIRYAILDTALGGIGIAWNERGLLRLQLPEPDIEATRRRVTARLPGAVEVNEADMPREIAAAADLIRRYASGEQVDFSSVPVAFESVDAFRHAVYRTARKLGFGETTTYGALAEKAGFPGMARETGTAMGRNPVPLVIPCHRVLAAGGRLGGFSAPGGVATKEKLLALEGKAVGPDDPAQASFAF